MRELPTTSNVSYSNTVSSGGDFFPILGAAPAFPQMSTRILRVILADPDENLPVEKRVLFQGPEKLTDLTDQELFFELPVQDLLAKHNECAPSPRTRISRPTSGAT
jgi:hypothetical protein